MSKVDDLRRMRELRWSARVEQPAATRVTRPARVPAPFEQPVETERPAEVETNPVATPPVTAPPVAAPPVGEPAAVDRAVLGPDVPAPGRAIGAYSDAQLQVVVRAVLAAGCPAEVEAVVSAVMVQLGFVRRGKVIRARVGQALDAVVALPVAG